MLGAFPATESQLGMIGNAAVYAVREPHNSLSWSGQRRVRPASAKVGFVRPTMGLKLDDNAISGPVTPPCGAPERSPSTNDLPVPGITVQVTSSPTTPRNGPPAPTPPISQSPPVRRSIRARRPSSARSPGDRLAPASPSALRRRTEHTPDAGPTLTIIGVTGEEAPRRSVRRQRFDWDAYLNNTDPPRTSTIMEAPAPTSVPAPPRVHSAPPVSVRVTLPAVPTTPPRTSAPDPDCITPVQPTRRRRKVKRKKAKKVDPVPEGEGPRPRGARKARKARGK